FEKILSIWRRKNPLQNMTSEFEMMLINAEWMFIAAIDVFTGKINGEDVKDDIYIRDIKINKTERLIRRQIITHLSINPDMDVPACLVFMSVVKDAERIGDYCKNIFQMVEKLKYGKKMFKDKYFDKLITLSNEIKLNLERTKEAFAEENEEKALKVVGESMSTGKRCDSIIESLLLDKLDIDSNRAVAYALLARHFKRIDSHLSNISTTVVAPVDRIDFPRKIKTKLEKNNA
ncbi:MAG: PhoU domain-containing protein, partial [Candidatus Auribacterota bacterium]|nr:PhoU domain-containing protein [Candidatus Auribacterota bacterium]